MTKLSLETKINFATKNSALSIVDTNAKLTLLSPMTITTGSLYLKDNSSNTLVGSSSNNLITLYDSILTTSNVVSFLNVTLDPTGTDKLTMAHQDYLNVTTGSIVQSLEVSPGATATIFGQPKFSGSINLLSSTSIIQMDITTTLNQSITGSGTVKLLNNLIVDKDIQIPSLCNLNSKGISFMGGSISNGTIFSGGGTIEFLSAASLTQTWTIGTTGESYFLVGNGNTLDLSRSGGIIFNGNSLTISSLIVKGLSSLNQIKGSGEIKLYNVTLALSSNIIRNDGKFSILGGDCKLITNGYTLTMSGAGNDFKVDGSIFWYEQLNTAVTTTPILTTNSANITKLNGGDILQNNPTVFVNAVGGVSSTFSNASNTLGLSYFITPSSTFQISNATPASPFPVSINGNGHFLKFPFGSGSYMILQNNVQLNLSNICLIDFNPAAISLGTSSSITFGDNSLIVLGPDLTIGSSDMSWTCTGNTTIDGNGATLNINKSGGITIDNAKTLTLKNLRIVLSSIDGIKALNDNAKIKMQNIDLVILNQGFTFSQGSIDIADSVKIIADTGTSTSNVNFEFASKGLLTVLASAELLIGKNMNFKYNPNTTSDGGVASVSKRHVVLSQIGSKLTICNGSIESTTFGLALDQGSMQIYDKVTITTTTGSDASFEFGTNLETNIMAGALLNVNGIVKYK